MEAKKTKVSLAQTADQQRPPMASPDVAVSPDVGKRKRLDEPDGTLAASSSSDHPLTQPDPVLVPPTPAKPTVITEEYASVQYGKLKIKQIREDTAKLFAYINEDRTTDLSDEERGLLRLEAAIMLFSFTEEMAGPLAGDERASGNFHMARLVVSQVTQRLWDYFRILNERRAARLDNEEKVKVNK